MRVQDVPRWYVKVENPEGYVLEHAIMASKEEGAREVALEETRRQFTRKYKGKEFNCEITVIKRVYPDCRIDVMENEEDRNLYRAFGFDVQLSTAVIHRRFLRTR